MTTAYCTYAEYRVAQAIFEHGYTNAQIAKTLCISTSCVNAHLRRLYQKLGIASDRELLTWMRQNTLKPRDYQSDRKQQKLKLCADVRSLKEQGLNNARIAKTLNINPSTVARYARTRNAS